MVTYCQLIVPLFPCTWLTKDFGYQWLTKTKKKNSKLTLGQPTVLYEITYLVSLFSVRGSINRRYTWNPEQY